MATLTIEGKLHKKGETVKISESFRKLEFVLMVEDGAYTQYVPFELLQDAVSKIEPFNEGDTIKVHFNLRGREYNGRYFGSNNAWRIESVNGSDTQSQEQAPAKVVTDKDGDDLPF